MPTGASAPSNAGTRTDACFCAWCVPGGRHESVEDGGAASPVYETQFGAAVQPTPALYSTTDTVPNAVIGEGLTVDQLDAPPAGALVTF